MQDTKVPFQQTKDRNQNLRCIEQEDGLGIAPIVTGEQPQPVSLGANRGGGRMVKVIRINRVRKFWLSKEDPLAFCSPHQHSKNLLLKFYFQLNCEYASALHFPAWTKDSSFLLLPLLKIHREPLQLSKRAKPAANPPWGLPKPREHNNVPIPSTDGPVQDRAVRRERAALLLPMVCRLTRFPAVTQTLITSQPLSTLLRKIQDPQARPPCPTHRELSPAQLSLTSRRGFARMVP